jgi:3-hydroxyisobutyrate dehydrogenase-like beta-hydroxyacid dehydrogenase
MAAVELVREILSSDSEDWKTWAFSFANTQGVKPYTVADHLEKVVSQDKLLNAGGTKKKALYSPVMVSVALHSKELKITSRASRRSVVQPMTAKTLSRCT